MQNLLTALPRCGAPAVDTIELYSPAGGVAHGSLDASVHVCADHVDEVMNAATAAGYTPYRLVNPHQEMRCGDGYDFTRGEMVHAPAPVLDDATHGNSGPGGPPSFEVGSAEYGRHHTPDGDAPTEAKVGQVLADFAQVSAQFPHPAWCQRGEGAGDTHTGRKVTINSRDGLGTVSCQLQLDVWEHAVPLLILTGDGAVLPMTVGQAKALAHSMRALVRVAGESS